MRRILFVKELGRRQGQGAGPEYKAGSIHTFTGHVAESYAQAYIDRGFAVEAPPEAKPNVTTSEPMPGVRLSKLNEIVQLTDKLLTDPAPIPVSGGRFNPSDRDRPRR